MMLRSEENFEVIFGAQVAHDQLIGIKAEARNVTVNEMFDLWCQIQRDFKNNIFENCKYMCNLFSRPNLEKSHFLSEEIGCLLRLNPDET